MRIAMSDILRLTNVVALNILKVLLNGQIMSPKQIARELDVNPADVRNALVHLKTVKLVDNLHYGEYTLSAFGKDYLEHISQSSPDHSSRRTET